LIRPYPTPQIREQYELRDVGHPDRHGTDILGLLSPISEKRRAKGGGSLAERAPCAHDEAVAARHKQKQKAQEQACGVIALEGVEAEHSSGELSGQGKQVWRSGSGIDCGGKRMM
jgi:hypothetical protein